MQEDHDALDRIEAAAESLGRRAQWEQGNRVGLLRVHAFIGLVCGPQMLLYGTAANIEAAVGVWARTALGLLGCIGGIVLMWGIVQRPRGIYAEAVGLALLGLWDVLMLVGFLAARIHGGNFTPRPLGDPVPVGYVLPYPIGIYGGMFALIVVHLWTLRRMKKGH